MSSVPLTSVKSTVSNSSPVKVSTAVLRAASITPPVAPNITAAPVEIPRGESNSSSGRDLKSIPTLSIILPNSRTVRDTSTSGTPAALWSGRPISNFLAVHGIIATTKISFGAIPIFSA